MLKEIIQCPDCAASVELATGLGQAGLESNLVGNSGQNQKHCIHKDKDTRSFECPALWKAIETVRRQRMS